MDRYRCSSPVDEQLLAGLVLLPQHHVLLLPPALVQLAEAAVAVAVRVCLRYSSQGNCWVRWGCR